ncbi:metallophosphoesterase [Anaplasma capra]|uniref:metallophosphoesterase n=1 Tax=Anaplasma capra TaxID=1562740 RepID=UPI0021D5E210|nr:metallophosphoesterase [Anaplasma capra]MCU7611847.1 metallophosphoesterase [Anaplasma capra]MCU7612677.1 metallophosphoesterase [Anaplasma capra]
MLVALYLLPLEACAEILFSWSQVVRGDKLSVRAVVPSGDSCPTLDVDHHSVRMGIRAHPEPGRFEDQVCESLLPPSSVPRVIKVGGRRLPDIGIRTGHDRRDNVSRIAVVGDTGCRVSRLLKQDCKSPSKWPLREVLSKISDQSPDLVVHIGDYLYRAVECTDETKCDKHVYGDNSKTWVADWLLPMQSVSDKLVFLFVRGNHEDCNRAHRGWFRYLDAHPLSEQRYSYRHCEEITDPWIFDLKRWGLGDVGLYVYDSSSSGEIFYRSRDVRNLREKFLKSVNLGRNSQMWLLTHRPLWAYWKNGIEYYGNLPQTRAIAEVIPEKFVAVFSGHVHFAQILSVRRVGKAEARKDAGRSPHTYARAGFLTQVISGNGGAYLNEQKGKKPNTALSSSLLTEVMPRDSGVSLNKVVGAVYRNMVLSGFTISNVNTFSGFGFCKIDIPINGKHSGVLGPQSVITFHGINGEESRRFFIGPPGSGRAGAYRTER